FGCLECGTFAGDIEDTSPLRGELARPMRAEAIGDLAPRFTKGARYPEAGSEHIAEGLEIIVRHPVDKGAMRFAERRHIEFLHDVAQILGPAGLRTNVPHAAEIGPRA